MVTMDLETMLIGLGIFIVSALLIYVISAFTMRETTFEQVMEEQKRKQEVLQSKPKEQKKDKKKKFKKGKLNDRGLEEVDKKDSGKEEKMVELEPDPEYIEASDSEGASTPPKKSKPGKTKPILINKEEKVAVTKEAPELFHRKNVPKDAVELKHERQQHHLLRNGNEEPAELAKPAAETRRANDVPSPAQAQPDLTKVPAAQQVKKDGGKKKKPAGDMVEEAMVVETVEKTMAVKLSSAAPELLNGCEPIVKPPKKNRQQEFVDPELLTNDGSSLLTSIQLAQLSDVDIKSLMEVLIGKHSNPDVAKGMTQVDWTKKGQKVDPLTQLRRQLEEKDRAYEEEQQRNLAGISKIKELNQELMGERQKLASLAKISQDQKGEIQVMQARMQESHVQHLTEVNHYRSQLEAKAKQTSDNIGQIQNLKEENKILQDAISKAQHLAGAEKTIEEQRQKVAFLDSALQQLSVQLNSADNCKKASENKVKQLEERIHEMENTVRESQAMAQQYKELSDKLHKSDGRLNSLNLELRRSEEERNGCVAELKSKEAQLNELNRRLMLNSSQLEDLIKNSQQKDAELQDLRAELNEARREARREETFPQQSVEKVDRAETTNLAYQANDQVIAEKDEAMKQIRIQLEEKLKELQNVGDELNSVKNNYSKLESEKNELLKSFEEKSEKSHERNIEFEELRTAVTRLESDSSSQTQELSRLVIELQQKDSDLERVRQESSSKSQEMSRLVNELLQKDAEVEKTKNEVDALRNDNAVLIECRVQCEEMKTSLVSLSEQLQQKEAKQIENEAHLMQLREKEARWVENEARWTENEASVDAVNDLKAKIDEKELELSRLKEERSEEENRLRSDGTELQMLAARLLDYELQLKELRESEEEWRRKDADSGTQFREAMSELETELSRLRDEKAGREQAEAELRRTLEASESALAARDLQLQQLQELNARAVEDELQLMELREKSAELQKLQETFGNLGDLETRMTQLAEMDEKLAESERNGAENEAKLRQVEDELAGTRLKLEELQRHLGGESTAKASSDNLATTPPPDVIETSSRNGGKSPDPGGKHREVTVFTHVQEKASWDMSKLVLDLDTKHAEIQILQSVLTQKESAVHELEDEKVRLMEMIENMQMELWAKDKQLEVAKSSNKQDDDVVKELNEAQMAKTSLQEEVVRYKTILADTERLLTQIESNVDIEEQKWRQKCEITMEENEKLKDELTRLKENNETHSVTD